MKRHRRGFGLAMVAALAVPVVVSAYRRTHPGDYTRSREFRALVGDYVI